MKNLTPTIDFYSLFSKAFDHFNVELFDGELPSVMITMQRKKNVMGYFSKKRWVDTHGGTIHEIAINPAYFANYPLLEIFQTICHEQCHQWQDEYGKPSRRTYHNKEWGEKMESIGLMPSATGRPGGKKTGQRMAEYAMEGGAFLKACESLVEQGFKLKWIDRFPATAIGANNNHAENLSVLESVQESAIANVLSAPINSSEAIQAQMVGSETPIKSPSKIKYTCDGCMSNVWGKPGLKLLCLKCETPYEHQDC